jgi:hypothetical protein
MSKKKLNLPPNHPKVIERVLERIRTMSPEELEALLSWRPEGVEVTNMNEELREYYQRTTEEEREENMRKAILQSRAKAA